MARVFLQAREDPTTGPAMLLGSRGSRIAVLASMTQVTWTNPTRDGLSGVDHGGGRSKFPWMGRGGIQPGARGAQLPCWMRARRTVHEARVASADLGGGGALDGSWLTLHRCARIFVTTGGSVMKERIRICAPHLHSSGSAS